MRKWKAGQMLGLEVEVESAGASSLIGRVGQIVMEAQQTRAPYTCLLRVSRLSGPA